MKNTKADAFVKARHSETFDVEEIAFKMVTTSDSINLKKLPAKIAKLHLLHVSETTNWISDDDIHPF